MKTFFCTGVFLLCLVGLASANPAYSHYSSQYNLKTNRDSHKSMYGYYPYYFSNSARSRYSYSDTEKGFKEWGRSFKEWTHSKRRPKKEIISVDSSRVLISSDSYRKTKELQGKLDALFEAAKKKKVVAKINAVGEINSRIKKHKWGYQSSDMQKAVNLNADNVKADPIDYNKMFEVK